MLGNAPPPDPAASRALAEAGLRILRALARVLLRRRMTYPAFAELAKRAFADAAARDFRIPGRRPTASRVAMLTGLSRREIRRLQLFPETRDPAGFERHHRIARVVSGWVRDRRFHAPPGRPAALRFDGRGPTFTRLVRRYGGDVTPRTVLDEILSGGAAECLRDGRVRLTARAYVLRGADAGKLALLGMDVAHLIETIDRNLTSRPSEALFQRKVSYDNVPREAVPAVRALAAVEAQRLLEALDRRLSRHDRDVNPSAGGSGRHRAGVGIFYFEDNLSENP